MNVWQPLRILRISIISPLVFLMGFMCPSNWLWKSKRQPLDIKFRFQLFFDDDQSKIPLHIWKTIILVPLAKNKIAKKTPLIQVLPHRSITPSSSGTSLSPSPGAAEHHFRDLDSVAPLIWELGLRPALKDALKIMWEMLTAVGQGFRGSPV